MKIRGNKDNLIKFIEDIDKCGGFFRFKIIPFYNFINELEVRIDKAKKK